MNITPGLGAFNKDKVANKFGIQLKPKDASQRSSTETNPITTGTSSTVTKNKTISDFRTDKNTNGFLSNNNRTASTIKTPELTRKKVIEKSPNTSKSKSGLVNTSVETKQQSTSLTSTVNHSTKKSPVTTKRSNVTSTDRTVSPAPPTKRPNPPKTEAQIQHQKDQPLYRRQSSKQLENTSSTTTVSLPTTTLSSSLPSSSTTTISLKR